MVVLTGLTLALAVATWAFSPIKFQADMGILLAFMFLVNMLGALILLPALAHFLLRPGGASANGLAGAAEFPDQAHFSFRSKASARRLPAVNSIANGDSHDRHIA
ncbi:hypothetical protein D9M68_899210 [compost metagenome]